MTPDIEKRLAEFGLKPTPLAFRYGPFQETANFYHEAEVLKLLKTLDTYRKGCEEAREALELQKWHSERMFLHLQEWIDEDTKEKHGHYRIAGDKENPFTRCSMMQRDIDSALLKLP